MDSGSREPYKSREKLFTAAQHLEVGRGNRLATLGYVTIPRSHAAWAVVLQAFHPSDGQLGGTKRHQLQIASNTNRTLNLSKNRLHFVDFGQIQLQKPSNPKIQLQ